MVKGNILARLCCRETSATYEISGTQSMLAKNYHMPPNLTNSCQGTMRVSFSFALLHVKNRKNSLTISFRKYFSLSFTKTSKTTKAKHECMAISLWLCHHPNYIILWLRRAHSYLINFSACLFSRQPN